MKHFLYALSTFAGTLIGVGFFSLPYLALQSGFLTVSLELLVLGAVVIIIHLLLAKIVIHTPEIHMLPGYAKYYLGKAGGIAALISSILGITSALIAYLIVGGGFLQNLLSPAGRPSLIFYILIYFAFGSLLVLFGVRGLGKSELVLLVLFFLVLIIFFIVGFSQVQAQNLFFENIKMPYLPIGAIIFSLWATSIVPSLREFFKNKDKNKISLKTFNSLSGVIILGVILGIICYFVFTLIVLGISGPATSQDALLGLSVFLPRKIIILGLVFGLLATFTSYIGLGFALKKILILDLKFNKSLAWIITCFLPLFLYIAGIQDFIKVISLGGSLFLGIEGVLIILIYFKMKSK